MATVDVTLEIDNVYEDETIRTVVQTTIEEPPWPPLSYAYEADDWEQDNIFCHTGTGNTDGEAAYFVTVTKSSRPDLVPVGTKYEFGL